MNRWYWKNLSVTSMHHPTKEYVKNNNTILMK